MCRAWRAAALLSAARRGVELQTSLAEARQAAEARSQAAEARWQLRLQSAEEQQRLEYAEELRINVSLCPAAAYCVLRPHPMLRALTINKVQTISAKRLLPSSVVALRITGARQCSFVADVLANTAIQTLVIENIQDFGSFSDDAAPHDTRFWQSAQWLETPLSSSSLKYLWLGRTKALPRISLTRFPNLVSLGLDSHIDGENI